MESGKSNFSRHSGPILTGQISRQIYELGFTPLENISRRVISVPQVSLFGEGDHTHRPRGVEMIDRARAASLKPPTHFVMEMVGDDQDTIDKYLSGELDTSMLQQRIGGIREVTLDVLSYAKERGVKVIAGDMRVKEMDRWLKEHPDVVKDVQQSTSSPTEAAVVLGVLMEKVRSFVTGRKIKEVLSDEDAEVWVNCGALHVSNILRGIYGLEEAELDINVESEGRSSHPISPPTRDLQDSKQKLVRDDGLSVVDNNIFAIVAQRAESNPDLRRLQEILDKIWQTPVIANSHLIQKAIEIIDASKGTLSDRERVSIYLELSNYCLSTQSSDQRPLVNRIMDLVDVLDLPADQKLQGLSKILSGTNLYQKELLQDILIRVDGYIPDVDSPLLLHQLQATLVNITGDLSQQLQKRVKSRLGQLASSS